MSKSTDILVSVIIPCYNCKEFIDETIESLENQTYKNFEVICVNDGSTDDTLEYLYSRKEKSCLNIIIVNQENGGVSKARNKGIESARGEYILFLDADDIYHRQYIEKMIAPAKEKDIVYCRLSRNLDDVKNYAVENNDYINETQLEVMNKLLYQMGRYGFYCYLYKKSILLQYNIYFDENTKHFEDREFIWKYLCHCNSAAWIDMPLYGYRVNENSVTRRKAQWYTDSLEAVRRTEKYLEKQHSPFSAELNSYLYARTMWALAKSYSVSRRKDLFRRLIKEFDVRKCMKRTAKDANKLVAAASVLYLLNPMLFYYAVGSKG